MNMEKKDRTSFDRRLASIELRMNRRQATQGVVQTHGDMRRLLSVMEDAK